MKKLLCRIFRAKSFYALIVIIAAISLGAYYAARQRKTSALITHRVERKDMTISVLEGGNLIAMRSQKVINEVPGNRTILEAVEVGTNITEQDVADGMVLVQLDSKDLEDRREQLKLNVENSWAAYKEEEQRLSMQKKQNESDLARAELNVKFARMDLEKYLGAGVAKDLIDNADNGGETTVDIASLRENPSLGGQALNKKQQLTNNIDIAKEQVKREEDKLEWSQKLAEEGYITQMELEADRLSLKQREVVLEQAGLEYELFLNYDFSKDVEKHFSDYIESLRELERVKANCTARLIQAEASLKSREATYMLNKSNLDDIERNIRNCTIVARQPGFVTMPAGRGRWSTQEPVQPGTVVRQHQELFDLPDFRSMGVEVNVHESSVRKLANGQTAFIKIDAFPEESFRGTVRRIAHMPDPTLQFLNPDINVYRTRVELGNNNEHLRPGMSAQVEIVINQLKNVIAIPVDTVIFRDGHPHCVVLEGSNLIEKKVELGESSNTLVEVKEGLNEGQLIVLQPRAVGSQIRQTEMSETGTFHEAQPLPESVEPQTQRDVPQAPSERRGTGQTRGDR